MIHLPDSYAWQLQAACRGSDPELFFPERGVSTDDAKALCRRCPVRVDCLEHALARGEKFGIWGGTSERERRRIRRSRRAEALARIHPADCACDDCWEARRNRPSRYVPKPVDTSWPPQVTVGGSQ